MADNSRYIIKDREQSAVAESFRALRSMLRNAEGAPVQTILFAGASSGEGNAMAAVNTGVSLAYAGKKVILVDCDLRAPLFQDVFRLQESGLTDILVEEKQLEEVLQNSHIDNLQVLTSGPLPSLPLEMLSNTKMADIIVQLQSLADYIIINSSPLIMLSNVVVSDACVLASKVDGVILTLDARTVRVKAAQKVLTLLKNARANMLGVVLNDLKDDKHLAY